MSLLNDLLAPPADLPLPSKYVVMNGVVYFATGALFVAWPGLVQRLFLEPPFVGHEESLFRIIGMTLAVIGWLYGFGGLAGTRQFVAATVIDRLILVPAVLIPLAIAGVFPHVALTFAVFDPALAIGAWVLLGRTSPMASGRSVRAGL